ncbi:hypothetical protein QFC21_004458 [Naganishia friedmannii]|uniref:Uncharacterized protein n=1 Tax=Naganishia friedmannii TaxID=89922 RepID=A0ACC2VGL2_9TREE|nr:hypothetical protein QFC21_004458 [Naganishia friedmannii]
MCTFPNQGRAVRNEHADAVASTRLNDVLERNLTYHRSFPIQEVDFLQLFPDGEHCAQQLLPASPALSIIGESPVNPIVKATSAKAQLESNEEKLMSDKGREEEMARTKAIDMQETLEPSQDGLRVTTNLQGGLVKHQGATTLPQGGSDLPQQAVPIGPAEPIPMTTDKSINHNPRGQPPVPPNTTGEVRAAEQFRLELQRQAERTAILVRSIEASRMLSEREEQESQYRAAWTRNAIDIFAADDTVHREIERQRYAQQVAKEQADQDERQRQQLAQQVAKEQANEEERQRPRQAQQVAKDQADQEERQRHYDQQVMIERLAKEKADLEQARRAAEVEEQRRRVSQEAEQVRLKRAQLQNGQMRNQMRLIAQEHRSALESIDKEMQARQREHKESEERIEREKEERARREEQRVAEQAEGERQFLIRQSEKKEADERAEKQRQIRALQQRAKDQLSAANAAAEEERLAQVKRAQATQNQNRINEHARQSQNAGAASNPIVLNERLMPRPLGQAAQFQNYQSNEGSNSSANTPIHLSNPHTGGAHGGPSSNIGNTSGPIPAIISELRNAMLQIEVQITSTQTKLQHLQASTNDGNSVVLKHVQQNVLVEQLRTLMNIHSKISLELQQQQYQARTENQARTVPTSVPLGCAPFVQPREQIHSHQSSYDQPQSYLAQNQHIVSNRPESHPSSYTQSHHNGPSSIPLNRTPLYALQSAQDFNQDHVTSFSSPVSHQPFTPNHVANPMSSHMQTQPQGPPQAQASYVSSSLAQGSAYVQERRESHPQPRPHLQGQCQSSTQAQASTNSVASAQSPAQSTSPALSQGRNSTGSVPNEQAPPVQRESKERAEQRRKEEDALARLRELEDRERKREEEYRRNKAAELEREAKRLSELRESQQTILRQQELIFQQSQLIASQQLQNHNVQNATSSELVTQGQLYMQNLSQAMQTHERLLRAQQFNMGIVQSPQAFGEPTPAFVDNNVPVLGDPQPFDILDIGHLPGENVQQDTSERFTEIHDNPTALDSAQSGRAGHQQGSHTRPTTAESRASEHSVPTSATSLRNASETASHGSSIRNAQMTVNATARVAGNPPTARTDLHADPRSSETASQQPPSHILRGTAGSMSLSSGTDHTDHTNHTVASHITPDSRPQPSLNNLKISTWSPPQREPMLQETQAATLLSAVITAPASAPLSAQTAHSVIQADVEEEDRKPIILRHGPPCTGVTEEDVQTPYTAAPILQHAQAMAPGSSVTTQFTAPVEVINPPSASATVSMEPVEAGISRVRERSDSESVQSTDERPVKRRRTDKSRFMPPKNTRRLSPTIKIEPDLCRGTTIAATTSTSTPSDHDTSPDSGTSGVVVEICVSLDDTSGILSGQMRKADGEVTPSTGGMGTISVAPPIPPPARPVQSTTTTTQMSQNAITTSQTSQTATAPSQGTPKRTSSVRQTLEVVFAKNPSPSDAAFRKLAEALKIEDIEPVKQLFALWRRNEHKSSPNPTLSTGGESAGNGT